MFGVHFPAKSDSQPLPLLPSSGAVLSLVVVCWGVFLVLPFLALGNGLPRRHCSPWRPGTWPW